MHCPYDCSNWFAVEIEEFAATAVHLDDNVVILDTIRRVLFDKGKTVATAKFWLPSGFLCGGLYMHEGWTVCTHFRLPTPGEPSVDRFSSSPMSFSVGQGQTASVRPPLTSVSKDYTLPSQSEGTARRHRSSRDWHRSQRQQHRQPPFPDGQVGWRRVRRPLQRR